MAGTLSVQQIQGLATAADPTTVTIPTGHTLTGNLDNTTPDQIIQYQIGRVTSTFDSTSSSYVEWGSTSFTPKKSDSHIYARVSGAMLYKYNTASGTSVYGQLRINGTQVWLASYMTYLTTSAQYMYTICAGPGNYITSPGANSAITVDFRINPNGDRTYIYGSTGVIEVWEVAQ